MQFYWFASFCFCRLIERFCLGHAQSFGGSTGWPRPFQSALRCLYICKTHTTDVQFEHQMVG